MIETICAYPTEIVMGVSAGVVAVGLGLITYFQKKKSEKAKFDLKKMLDTAWQSIVVGIVAGMSIPCGYTAILLAMATGYGVDKIANKIGIKGTQVLNLVQLIGNLLTKADKKVTKKKK